MKKQNKTSMKVKMLDSHISVSYDALKANIDKIPKNLFFIIRKKMRLIEPIHNIFVEDTKAAWQHIISDKDNTTTKDGNEILTLKGAKEMKELQKELDLRESEVEIIEPRLTEEQIEQLPQEINIAIYYLENIL